MSIFESINLIEILQWTGLLLLGAGLSYYRTNTKLQKRVAFLISQAEASFVGAKVGGKKFAWVCDTLYGVIPAPLRVIITRQMIEEIVQGTFNSMATYTKMQFDKLVDTAIPDTIGTEEK